ncbi:MAG: cell division protein FtsA [Candidatus Shapirobacteria bacterium]|nr:cell division protein FtsA [Candidatus Shapirobacteria bacterium]
MPRPQIIAGIDIGSSKIATVIASVMSEDEEGKLRILGVASTPSRGIRKGQIVNIEETTESLLGCVESAERMAGYNLNRVSVSVSGPNISSNNSRGVVAVAEPENEITKEDIKRVIEAAQALSLPASRQIIHVLPRYFTVDGQEGIKDPIGMSGVRLEVETHIVSGSTTSIKNLTRCVSEIGIETQSLVVSGLAAAESVLTETEKELGVILVDIGGGVTDIVIYIEGSPFYTTVLPIGAKNVTNDLAIGLRLSLESAEKIKIALSEKNKKAKGDEDEDEKKDEDEINLADLGIIEETKTISKKTLIEGIIKPRLNEIFAMVGMEIKKSGAGGLTPSGVVICGGGAQTVGIVEAAKKILSMPVRVGQPSGLSGLIDDMNSPEYAVAAGLILYKSKQQESSQSNFSLGRIGKTLQKMPMKGVANKFIDLIKSFMP